MSWTAGDPAPERPQNDDPQYVRKLERYADDVEQMLVWLVKDYAQFSNLVAARFREVSK